MIGNIPLNILVTIITLVVVVITHELAHGIIYEHLTGKKAKFRFLRTKTDMEIILGTKEDFDMLGKRQMVILYVGGILAGYIPMLLMIEMLGSGYLFAFFLSFFFYTLILIRSDVIEIFKELRGDYEKKT